MVLSNYRPISMLPIIKKKMEQLMYDGLSIFLTNCKIVNDNQFGFRNNHSTYMGLLVMFENLRNALDDG